MGVMTTDLERAARAYQRAKATADARYAELVNQMYEDSHSGVPQTQIIEQTGYSREQVRRIVRKVEEDRAQAAGES